MTTSPAIHILGSYLEYLKQAVHTRLKAHFDPEFGNFDLEQLKAPVLDGPSHPIKEFIKFYQLDSSELLLLLIALAPHVESNFFDQLIKDSIPEAGDFPEFGGVRGKQFRGFLPTGETFLFILGGNNLALRFEAKKLLSADHFLVRNNVLWLEEAPAGEPAMSGKLIIDQDYIDLFCNGYVPIPRRTAQFPAEHLSTPMEWSDLVLPETTWGQIRDIEVWIKHHYTLLQGWGMQKRLKPGYRALFYGPPGTGKTLTATLLGKYTKREVFKIDLSMVVSKYIGETEKNLSSLFDKARNKDWILFFDEADSIFGKRTNVRDAHDKYANQEVSYLLQRIESYSGLTILASNLKNNIDDAFTRRFQNFVHFPFPKPAQRLELWKKAFPPHLTFEESIDFQVVAKKYELSGSNIMNIVQYCCLKALDEGTEEISLQNLNLAIRKELLKEGKSI